MVADNPRFGIHQPLTSEPHVRSMSEAMGYDGKTKFNGFIQRYDMQSRFAGINTSLKAEITLGSAYQYDETLTGWRERQRLPVTISSAGQKVTEEALVFLSDGKHIAYVKTQPQTGIITRYTSIHLVVGGDVPRFSPEETAARFFNALDNEAKRRNAGIIRAPAFLWIPEQEKAVMMPPGHQLPTQDVVFAA